MPPTTDWNEAAAWIRTGKLAVIPTDTIYGLVAAANEPASIERLNKMKGRDAASPYIILIAEISDLQHFGISLSKKATAFIESVWPGPVSIILPCPHEAWAYLHKGRKSLAFRLPSGQKLQSLLLATGPLAAPSANPSGKTPAATIEEARNYFGPEIYYLKAESEPLDGKASTLVDLSGPVPRLIRQGTTDISQQLADFTS